MRRAKLPLHDLVGMPIGIVFAAVVAALLWAIFG